MAVNLATKYAQLIDERFSSESLTAAAVNQDYDFIGAQSVKVYSMATAPMNDYQNAGNNRYGTPAELQDTTQELTMRKKRSFTFTIDKTNAVDSPEGVRDAAAALSRQLNEVVIPEIDQYRMVQMASGAGHSGYGELTKANAYEEFLKAAAALAEAKVPLDRRIAFVTPDFYSMIKQDGAFVRYGDLAQDMLVKGQIGMVDGISLVLMPSAYMPAGLSFLITHPSAVTAPQKLSEYVIHENPPGIAGNLVEGLTYYDCFVLNNKKDSIYAHFGKLGSLQISMTAAGAGQGKIAVSGNAGGSGLVYKTGATVTAPALGEDLASWTALPADGVISATAGNKVAVAVKSAQEKCVAVSDVIDVVVGA